MLCFKLSIICYSESYVYSTRLRLVHAVWLSRPSHVLPALCISVHFFKKNGINDKFQVERESSGRIVF